ncbi:hypothetical protein AC579_7792 [Pseudocercospora musae]|uniref:Uncharacterized protein n=1 Tax=Pseudocercospora musae TaxID=113226 RepID=A0A139IJF5_9PEZI|nr:hypothetical protein AC579_7792 [Pseudocercospora musae]KXT14764.1 hypothetical protein AC579_7792 [Pseudocercospora musae]KXT14765.1 hypothetical protein AC579_7792 [Pseudocercospora musae]
MSDCMYDVHRREKREGSPPATSKRPLQLPGNLLKPVISVNEDGIDMKVLKHISTFPPMSDLKETLPKAKPDSEDDTRMLEAPANSCPHDQSQLCNGCSARNSCSECQAPMLACLPQDVIFMMRNGVHFDICLECVTSYLADPEEAHECGCEVELKECRGQKLDAFALSATMSRKEIGAVPVSATCVQG